MNDREFFERRMREKLARAAHEQDEKLKTLHTFWAGLYAERLTKLAEKLDLAA